MYWKQILLPMNFEYVLLILITLAFLGVRYLVVTLYNVSLLFVKESKQEHRGIAE